jgi:hypothetical protein
MKPSPILIKSDLSLFALAPRTSAFCERHGDMVLLFFSPNILGGSKGHDTSNNQELHVGLFIAKKDI